MPECVGVAPAITSNQGVKASCITYMYTTSPYQEMKRNHRTLLWCTCDAIVGMGLLVDKGGEERVSGMA